MTLTLSDGTVVTAVTDNGQFVLLDTDGDPVSFGVTLEQAIRRAEDEIEYEKSMQHLEYTDYN